MLVARAVLHARIVPCRFVRDTAPSRVGQWGHAMSIHVPRCSSRLLIDECELELYIYIYIYNVNYVVLQRTLVHTMNVNYVVL